MNKSTLTIVLITAIVVLILDNKLRTLPGVNKLPTV
jgi:hypothetical protein